MAYLPLFVGVAFAVAFFRAAQYERMSPAAWSVASMALTLAVTYLVPGIAAIITAQVVLFILMWLYNAKRRSAPRNDGD